MHDTTPATPTQNGIAVLGGSGIFIQILTSYIGSAYGTTFIRG